MAAQAEQDRLLVESPAQFPTGPVRIAKGLAMRVAVVGHCLEVGIRRPGDLAAPAAEHVVIILLEQGGHVRAGEIGEVVPFCVVARDGYLASNLPGR